MGRRASLPFHRSAHSALDHDDLKREYRRGIGTLACKGSLLGARPNLTALSREEYTAREILAGTPLPREGQLHLSRRLLQPGKQRECRDGDLPMPLFVARRPHGVVVRERDEGYPRRVYSALHRKRHRRDSSLLDGRAYQADGPVAKRSGWREQDRINAIVSEHPGDLRRGLPDEWFGVVDGAHEREVTVVESSDDALFHESSGGP